MITWAMWAACGGEPEPDYHGPGSAEPIGGGDTLVEYDDVGFACIDHTALYHPGEPIRVIVDFEDCLFCSTDLDLWCEATLAADGTTIEVHGGGSLIVVEDCGSYRSTCEGTTATCDGPALEPGDYTLSYGGIEVPVTLPATEWVCTLLP
jgi:hypothetical protein